MSRRFATKLRRARPNGPPIPWQGALLLLVASWACSVPEEMDQPPLLVLQEPLVVRHHLTGEVVAERAVDLVVPRAGPRSLQIRWLADHGSEVAAGATVVELDSTELVSSIDDLQMRAVEAAMALQAAEAEAASKVAEAEFQLLEKQSILDKAELAARIPESLKAARDWDALQLELQSAQLETEEAELNIEATKSGQRASVEVERIALETAERELRRAEEGADRLTLRAPAQAGIVLLTVGQGEGRRWQVGDSVQRGWTLVRLPELDSLVVRARLDDVDDGRVEVGQVARVLFDAHPDEEIVGRIRSVAKIARSPRRSSRSAFEVMVELSDPDLDRLSPGMSARVTIEESIGSRGESPSLLAPREALVIDQSGRLARALLSDGSWREVEIERCSPRHCLIQGELSVGTELARVVKARS